MIMIIKIQEIMKMIIKIMIEQIIKTEDKIKVDRVVKDIINKTEKQQNQDKKKNSIVI